MFKHGFQSLNKAITMAHFNITSLYTVVFFLSYGREIRLGTRKIHMKNAKLQLKKNFSYLHIIWMQPPRVLVHVLT